MRIKVIVDFEDDGEEDAYFQGWQVEGEIRSDLSMPRKITAVALFFENVKEAMGFNGKKD